MYRTLLQGDVARSNLVRILCLGGANVTLRTGPKRSPAKAGAPVRVEHGVLCNQTFVDRVLQSDPQACYSASLRYL